MNRNEIRNVVVSIMSAAAYGFAIGSAHSWLYAGRNVLKFPLLVLGTGIVSSLAYFVAARFLGVHLGFAAVQRIALGLFRDMSIMLGSLAPPVAIVGIQLAQNDDGWLGEYGMFLGWNVVMIGSAATFALILQVRALRRAERLTTRRSVQVAATWLVISLFVGGQLAFWCRPFFGFPATRGVENTPFVLGSTPDVRGATNFYESVLQVIEHSPLPEAWRRGG